MDTEILRNKFDEFCKSVGLDSGYVSIAEHYINDDYFTKHRDIFDSSEYWFEDVEVDFTLWFKREYPLCDDIIMTGPILELAEVEDYEDMIGVEYGNLPAEAQELVEDWYEQLEYYDVVDNSDIREFFETGDYVEDQFNELEAMAYWTVYFEPITMDEEVAHRCGLLPFRWKDQYELLALCGCGMDLSPKLDAYQALVNGSLPSDSQFFRQPSYFEYVSHIPIEEIDKATRRQHARVTFNAEVKA